MIKYPPYRHRVSGAGHWLDLKGHRHTWSPPWAPPGVSTPTSSTALRLLALTCPHPWNSTRSVWDSFFKITERLLGFDFTLACSGKDSNLYRVKLPMLSKFYLYFTVFGCKMPQVLCERGLWWKHIHLIYWLYDDSDADYGLNDSMSWEEKETPHKTCTLIKKS